SGYGRIAFTCQVGQDELSFAYEHEPTNAVDGVEVDAVLAAGDVEVSIPTTGARLEIDDVFLLEGQARLDDALRKLLTSGGVLTIMVEDGAAEYPLDGAAQAAEHLLRACRPDACGPANRRIALTRPSLTGVAKPALIRYSRKGLAPSQP